MSILKKTCSLALACCILLSLAACGKTDTPAGTTAPGATTATTPNADTQPQAVEQTVVVNTEGMTDLQKAVVITAESYYLRGAYAQYDMGTLVSADGLGKVERRITGIKNPEDYTRQHTGYIDCSGFVCDVYTFALGMRISSGTPWTKSLTTSSHVILKEKPSTTGFADMTEAELAAKEKTFVDTLQPGDIIVYRYAGEDAGHAMLYVGNGMMIHSSGKSFDHTNKKENYEEAGTFLYEPIANSLLKKGDRRYLFDKSIYVILRPLNKFTKEIPETTQTRMELMRGVMAEKYSSHTYGQNVAPGNEITFTFYLKNHSNVDKTLTITDTLSEHTTYVSGAEVVDGNNLRWTVSLPAGGEKEISYTVKVKADAAAGNAIKSSSTVCGIKVNCPDIQIGNTLTQEQSAAVSAAFNQLKDSKSGISLINAIYQQACGKAVFTESSVTEIWSAVSLPYAAHYGLSPNAAYASIYAPNLYGGRLMVENYSASASVNMRTRMVKAELLINGDVILAGGKAYLFIDGGLWDLQTMALAEENRLETLITEDRFVVFRPSLGF